MMERAVLRPGDWVCFDGSEHQVVGLAGTSVRLRSEAGEQVVLAGHLMAAADFAVIGAGAAPAVEPFGLLDAMPAEVLAEAERWRHIVEVETGLPPDAPTDAVPREEFDPSRRSLAERQQAKAVDLDVTARTIERRRARYAYCSHAGFPVVLHDHAVGSPGRRQPRTPPRFRLAEAERGSLRWVRIRR